MKGILFTLSLLIIAIFILIYFATSTSLNVETARFINEEIASNRIFYTWMGVADNFHKLTGVSIEKIDDRAKINDSLPSNENNIKDLLTQYQQFVDQYVKDSTIFIRFEDASGNPTNLNETQPKIIIKPMNINYTWPNYGKKEMFLKSSTQNFSYIRNITYEITVNSTFTIDTIPNPKICPATYCLNFTLRVKNSTYTWEWSVYRHDIDFKNWADINVAGTTQVARVETGDINPGQDVLHLNIVKPEFVLNTSMDILFNTTQFYIDFPTKLNVTSDFAKRIDWI